jgi:hypothetical protein
MQAVFIVCYRLNTLTTGHNRNRKAKNVLKHEWCKNPAKLSQQQLQMYTNLEEQRFVS